MNRKPNPTKTEATARRYSIGNGQYCFYIRKDGRYLLKSLRDDEETQELVKATIKTLNEAPLLEAIVKEAIEQAHASERMCDTLTALADYRKQTKE